MCDKTKQMRELDVVRLDDGRLGTILEISDHAYLVEVQKSEREYELIELDKLAWK